MFIINCKNYNEISGEKINKLANIAEKISKKGVCPNCRREYLLLTNWHDKSDWCPYCLDEFDEYE